MDQSKQSPEKIGKAQIESLCTKCGARFGAEASFCGFDGAELLISLADKENGETGCEALDAKHCPTCLRAYPSYAKFCGVDGRALVLDAGDRLNPEPPLQSRASVSLAEDEMDLVATPDLSLVGQTLEGKYRIDSVLAEGGMAVLYLGHQKAMERQVAIKVVHGALISSATAVKRFEREAKLMARLNHPNIVSIYDFGFVNDRQPFMVMEYIKGMNITDKVAKQGPPSEQVAAQIIRQICLGLEEAHSSGIIHRDLKPDNILLQENPQRPDWVKIVDFGIAHLLDGSKRLTGSGRVTGTPAYMSPEQFKDVSVDARSDIYSLGVVIFEMLTFRLPFEADDLGVLMAQHLMETPPSVSVLRPDIASGSPLDLLIAKCLQKDPNQRFQHVRELSKLLEQVLP